MATLGLVVLAGCGGTKDGPLLSSTATTSATELDRLKTLQEVRQLQLANRDAVSPWHRILEFGPSVTVAIAVLSLIAGGIKYWIDRRNARQQDHDLRLRETEAALSVGFATAVSNLGSIQRAVRVNGAASMSVFARESNPGLAIQIVETCAANLRLPSDKIVASLLARALQRAVAAIPGDQLNRCEIDLSNIDLPNLELVSFTTGRATVSIRDGKLPNVRLDKSSLWQLAAAGADVSAGTFASASLGQARFDDATCTSADFRGARLTSASFRRAKLQHVKFRGAALQSAHFEDADLRGANFESANLTDAYFAGAIVDPECLASIQLSSTWRRAHFAPAVRALLPA